MKLPVFSDFIEEYRKQVSDVITGCIRINETSFSEHNTTLASTAVKLEEYSSPQLIFSIDIKNPDGKCYGFNIQCVCKDRDGALVDLVDTFVNLDNGRGSGMKYATVHLPEDLGVIEVIEIAIADPIYEYTEESQ